MLEAEKILRKCSELGIFLEAKGDRISYRGPKKSLRRMVPILKRNKPDLLQLLRRRKYIALVVCQSGIFSMPARSPDSTWLAIDTLAKELERHGLSSSEALKRAHHEITMPGVKA
jgi:hypothetical protein